MPNKKIGEDEWSPPIYVRHGAWLLLSVSKFLHQLLPHVEELVNGDGQ